MPWGVMFALMLLCFGVGAVLIFINFLALRQAVTPAPLLGRMTSTMRWLILLPAGPGALIGGWLGEHLELRSSLVFAGCGALLVRWLRLAPSALRGARVADARATTIAGRRGRWSCCRRPSLRAGVDADAGATARSGRPRR